jgi:hypothetical protein
MREQREFLEDLAVYCIGKQVSVRDARIGIVDVDLTTLIREYNQMNIHPQWESKLGYQGFETGFHGPAGFLGVFGNIATCNFIHAAVLMQFATSEHKCGCAGDDAVIVLDVADDPDHFYGCISLLGLIQSDKVYNSEDIDVIYLKRKTFIGRDFCLRQSHYFQCPSLLPFIDWGHDIRFRERSLKYWEIRELAAHSLQSSFRSAQYLSPEECLIAKEFLRQYYTLINFSPDGNLRQLKEPGLVESRQPSYPSIDHVGHPEYLKQTAIDLYNDVVYLPDRDPKEYEGAVQLKSGIRFKSNVSTFHLRYLERLGAIKKRVKGRRKYMFSEGYTRLLQEVELSRLPDVEYTYEVVSDIGSRLWPNERFDIVGEIVDDEGDKCVPVLDSHCQSYVSLTTSAHSSVQLKRIQT